MKNYQSIYRWGDKRDEILSTGIVRLIKDKFGFKEEDFANKPLVNTDEVKLDKKSLLTKPVVQQFIDICGTENVLLDDYSRATHAYGKYYTDLLYLRKAEIEK